MSLNMTFFYLEVVPKSVRKIPSLLSILLGESEAARSWDLEEVVLFFDDALKLLQEGHTVERQGTRAPGDPGLTASPG